MDIYLDIDGVLLNEGVATSHVHSFLDYILTNYPDTTYWLTTRCNGDADATVAQIIHLFDESTQGLIRRVRPTSWPIIKTQAINFSRPFLWFDDQLGYADKQNLLEHDSLDNLILVDLKRDPDALKHFSSDFPIPM